MNVLWVGQEDIDYESVVVNGGYFDYYTGVYRPGYGRGALKSYYGPTSADPNPARLISPNWTSASSDFWISLRVAFDGGFTIPTNTQLFAFYDSSKTRRLIIRASQNSIAVAVRTSAGGITELGSWGIAWGTYLQKIDVHVVYGTSGGVTIYSETSLVGSYSGDVTTNGATSLQSVDIGFLNSGSGTYYTEAIVAEGDTRYASVVTLTTSTAGASQQWAGTASYVNQNSLVNDALAIYSTSANQIQQYVSGSLPTGYLGVAALVVTSRLSKGTAGPQKAQTVARVGGTNYTPIAAFDVTGALKNYQTVISQNPSTGTSWSKSDIAPSNLQYGIKSVA